MDYNYEFSDQLFNKFSRLIYQNIGVNLPLKKKSMVKSRLAKRIRRLRMNSFAEYYDYLSDNDAELVQLYNLLTTNVTKFFREDYHFQFLQQKLFPRLKRRRQKRLYIWSAGCSSGEEVYSLAITIREFFDPEVWKIKILATDINTEVLEAAQEGIYHYRQVKSIPYNLLKKYFKLGRGSNNRLFKVKDELKQLIRFKRLNLNQKSSYPIDKRLDFIFCRNVFIYFNQEIRDEILARFHSHLRSAGHLFLGHSESISRLTDNHNRWQPVYKTVYQKR